MGVSTAAGLTTESKEVLQSYASLVFGVGISAVGTADIVATEFIPLKK